jgi:hypothetical protein
MDVLGRRSLQLWFRLVRAAGRWAVLALIFCGAGTPCVLRLPAQSAEPTEYQVKAAFLFNFAKFVEWPEAAPGEARAPFVLGVLGDDPFGGDLASIVVGQAIRGRAILIRKYHYGDDLRVCQVLFVSVSERPHVAQILASLQGSSALTVSDIDGFAEAGGVMQFVIEDSKVRFVVNLAAAEKSRLRISSKLLALARVVNRAEGSQSR